MQLLNIEVQLYLLLFFSKLKVKHFFVCNVLSRHAVFECVVCLLVLTFSMTKYMNFI